MPRDSNGNYSLPAGNPVVTGEIISSAWANTTLDDIAAAVTQSLSRYGEGGMMTPLELTDGSGGLPALTFTSEPTSGLYLAGAGDMRFAIGGTDIITMTVAGVTIGVPFSVDDLLLGDGAAATPSLGFTNSPTTGFYRGGADILGISTAATSRVTIDATGHVSIAAVASGAALSVVGINNQGIEITATGTDVPGLNISTPSVNFRVVTSESGSRVDLGTSTNHEFRIKTNDTARLTVSNAGVFSFAAPSSGATAAFAAGAYPSVTVTGAGENINTGLQLNNASGSRRLELGYLGSSAGGAYGVAAGNSFINALNGLYLCSNDSAYLTISTAGLVQAYIAQAGGLGPIGSLNIPPTTFNTNNTQDVNDAGTVARYVGGAGDTWTTYTATYNGETVTIVNNGGGALSIACAGTMRWFTGAATTDGSPRTLAVGGVATLVAFGSGANNWMLWGSGIT